MRFHESLFALAGFVLNIDATTIFDPSDRRPQDEPCILMVRATEHEDQDQTMQVDCYVPSTDRIVTIAGPPNIQAELLAEFESGAIISNESVLRSSSAYHTGNGQLQLPNGLNDVEFSVDKTNRQGASAPHKFGTNTMLAVKITGSDDVTTTADEGEISDGWFGNGRDTVNIVSQYLACSYGALKSEKATSNNSADGVLAVSIPLPISGDHSLIREAAVQVVANEFADSALPIPDLVMYCVPPGTSGSWIAYAYFNDEVSVYNNAWCGYVSVQMHEIGHNLGLHHSGEGSDEYGDQSGMMGYSYCQDETPLMCFNAPKNHQLGWYSGLEKIINTDTEWTGTIYGIADADGGHDGAFQVVFVLIEDSIYDWYVSFNGAAGINSQTVEGGNQVLVHRRITGTATAKSTLYAKLDAGGEYTGAPLDIIVNSIYTGPALWHAFVTIKFKATTPPVPQPSATAVPTANHITNPSTDPSSGPIALPSVVPSLLPSVMPSVRPSDDPTPSPSGMPSDDPSKRPSLAPSSKPSKKPSSRPSALPSMVPSLLPSVMPSTTPVPSGQFIITPVPTSQPIINPSTDPSSGPIALPSVVPSLLPSVMPSVRPSDDPTPSPSGMPSDDPSKRPSLAPSSEPSKMPSSRPSALQYMVPSLLPSVMPSVEPSESTPYPITAPSPVPTGQPQYTPDPATGQPIMLPTDAPVSPGPVEQPTHPPKAPPTNPIPTPVPTGQPQYTPDPATGQPIMLPTAPPVCNDTPNARFLWKIKFGAVTEYRPKSCNWLSKMGPRKTRRVCKNNLCKDGLLEPRRVCPEACKFCGACEEKKKSNFYYSQQFGKIDTRPCEWLRKEDISVKETLCEILVSPTCYGTAREICPKTCKHVTNCGGK